ncbi:MAG: hypothetical protein PHI06_13500, partial [Desulfobulbaceae bacterium]|nr:hypothetical protein [Desulfobulbaceae bacterium]
KDQAAEEYRTILKKDASFAPAANNLAWYMAENGQDLGEALRLAMVAKAGSPEDPYVADTLGWVHYKRASYDLAKSQFVQALEKLENNPTVNYHLGLTMEKLADKAKAVESLQKAIDLGQKEAFPEMEQAKTLLGQLGK